MAHGTIHHMIPGKDAEYVIQGSQVTIQTCLRKITDPIQTYFWIKYRPFTDPVMYEIQT